MGVLVLFKHDEFLALKIRWLDLLGAAYRLNRLNHPAITAVLTDEICGHFDYTALSVNHLNQFIIEICKYKALHEGITSQ